MRSPSSPWLVVSVASLAMLSCDGKLSVPGPFGLETRPSNTTCVAFARPTTGAIALQRMWPNQTFNAPIAIRQAPADKSRFFIVEQAGRIVSIGADASSTPQEVLDFRDEVLDGGELGMLGFAFAPDFATSGKVYIYYTAAKNGVAAETRVSEFKSSDNGATIDKATERIVLRIDQPYSNHNGGNILFGPDGFLYIGMGDGGSGGDPENYGQNNNSLLGKMLRIDVSKTEGAKQYAIPSDNPFASGAGGAPEIFATGLRNPWRWSFDRENGKLWAGDVGQNAYEEIDVIERGKNYGWRGKEGFHCYDDAQCDNPAFVDPIAEHGRNEASSITGGYVYRGTAIPSLVGRYIYGDFATGNVWTFVADGQKQTPERALSGIGNIATWGEDNDGEIYVGLFDGTVRKVIAQTGGSSDGAIPTMLSATGCVSTTDPKQPATGMIPYSINAELWSDGAEKSRWMALPNGKTVGIGADGDFDFPNGSVLVKEFRIGGKRIETRLLVRHDDGGWAGYTYEWRDDESDATLLADTKTKSVGGGQMWTYPSRSDCMRCHTEAAGHTLGPELGQLNSDLAYPGGKTGNQLATLHHIGVVELSKPPASTVRYASIASTTDSLEARARSYLHSNCGNCHRPGGPTPTALDLRYATAFGDTQTCEVAPSAGNLGVGNATLVKPGAPASSVVALRMKAMNTNRMPPLGSRVVHDAGVKLVEDWIAALTGCP